MSVDPIRSSLERALDPLIPPRDDLEPIVRRARRLRIARIAAAVAVASVLAAGIVIPLGVLHALRRGPGSDGPAGGIRTTAPATTPATGGSSSPGGPPALDRGAIHLDNAAGLSILTPPGWWYLKDPSGPLEPSTILAVANYPIRFGGSCAPTRAQGDLPPDGALAWLIEYHDGQGSDFPPRPPRFSLDPSTLANYECSARQSYLIRFEDEGRRLQLHVTFGRLAGPAVRRRMLSILSSLKFDRCPPGVEPGLVTEFGSVEPASGPPGTVVRVTGPTGRDEDWFWSPLPTIEIWWSRGPLGQPVENPDQRMVATIDPGTTCSFEASFPVPTSTPGPYLITVVGFFPGAGGYGVMGERTFQVTR